MFDKIQEFNCRNDTMSNYLKQSAYYNFAGYEENTTLVMFYEDLIGYFTLKMGEVNISDVFYPALEIRRLAIETTYQNRNTGGMVIEYIEDIAKQVNVRFIKLEGLKEYQKWYEKQGFELINSDDSINKVPTVSMYKDLHDERLLERYLEG